MTQIEKSWQDPERTPFDFILVGAGAGGAPLAARLVERGYTVLVVEMGPGEPAQLAPGQVDPTRVPMLHPESTEDRHHSLQFFVRHFDSDPAGSLDPKVHRPEGKPEEHGIFYPRAQGVGGCTVHNAMITMCGPSEDWDEIAETTGDESWRGERMRAYFQRLERCNYARPSWWARIKSLFGFRTEWDNSRHGTRGWLDTSFADLRFLWADRSLLQVVFGGVHGTLEEGIDRVEDILGAALAGRAMSRLDPNHWDTMRQSPQGISLIPTAITPNGERSGPRERLLSLTHPDSPHARRLHLLTGVLVTRVHLDYPEGKPPHATGVVCLPCRHAYQADPEATPIKGSREEHEVTIRCRKEVILCGGAFNTPQLLMLSGIGDAGHLAEKKIDARVNLPGVGKNLQDRYEVPVTATVTDRFQSLDQVAFSSTGNDPELQRWVANAGRPARRRGIYSTNGGLLGIFLCSQQSRTPDLFIFASPVHFRGYEVDWSKPRSLLRLPADASDDQVASAPRNRLTWLILKARTRHHAGEVTLRSNDPLQRPDINFRSFPAASDADLDASGGASPSNDADLEALHDGVQFVQRFLAEGQRQGKIQQHDLPDLKLFDGNVRKWIKHIAWGHHACGTCKMGGDGDPQAVLDSRFRVRGVAGLRVVDASIFPRIPGFFIVANIYMIAEKAADVLAEDHRLPLAQRPPEVQEAERVDPVLPSSPVFEARRLYPAELEAAEAARIAARRRAATPSSDARSESSTNPRE